MQTYQINILDPRAVKLLKDLADLNLISIKEVSGDNFMDVVRKLRSKAANHPPPLKEITKEVEAVRAKHYTKNKA